MTQKELGVGIEFDEKGADNRIAQYETIYRVLKKDILLQIAKILDVNPLNFICKVSGSVEDIMQTFFWLDADNPVAINLFHLVRSPGKCNASDDTAVRYNDARPAHPPVGLWFKYGFVDDFMREWLVRKNELKLGRLQEKNIGNGN